MDKCMCRSKPKLTIWCLRKITLLLFFGYVIYVVHFLWKYNGTNHANEPGFRLVLKTNTSSDPARKSSPLSPSKPTVAYMISLTGCSNHYLLDDFAAVLQHSIRSSSKQSRYEYQLYAVVHPDAEVCSGNLTKLGYKVLIRDTPVAIDMIEGRYLRENIAKGGCCGEKELIKLYSYTLSDHPIAVHLDLDSFVLNSMDDVFDVMLEGLESPARNRVSTMFHQELPEHVDALFTRDYNMFSLTKKHVGVQGGFFICRPSQAAFDEYVDIIREGNYTLAEGWHKTGHGAYHYGGETIQGLIPYYYDERHPGTAIELDRCKYNAMGQRHTFNGFFGKNHEGKCVTREARCVDCRETKLTDVVTAHLAACHKPLNCFDLDNKGLFESGSPFDNGPTGVKFCKELHRTWFQLREEAERVLVQSGIAEKTTKVPKFFPEINFGYCKTFGKKGYIQLRFL